MGMLSSVSDSLDEVDPQQRTRIIELINTWASNAGNIWIVGSRFTDYKGGQFKRGQFSEWELLPINHALRQELAQRLLPELQRLSHEPHRMLLSPLAFLNILEHYPRAAAWGENPLLFSLAAVVFARKGTLPSSRAALYHEVIDAILETREKDSIQRKMLRHVGADLALRLYQLKGRIFTYNDLLDILPAVREDQQENWDTVEMATRMVTSGMLEVVAHETYGFRHQTIQEYLAAIELARRLVSQEPATREQAWNLVWSKRTYSRWTEVLRLLVGILAQEHGKKGAQEAQRWLRALIEQQMTSDGDLGDLGLALALKSLGEVAEATTDWKEMGGMELEREIGAIWVDGLLETFGHKRAMRRERLQVLAREVSGLGVLVMRIVTSRLVDTLSDKDSRVRAAAVRTLAEIGEPVLAIPLMDALDDTHEYVRAVAVQVLGELGERMPVEPLLKALDDPHEYVRGAAAQALGMLGERMPVEPLLKALNDPHEYVRGAAAQALGMLGERMPVEPLLKALNDPHGYVRGAAAQALGKLGERMPVEPLLKALDDSHEYVRGAAAQALGKLGERMPVEPLLKALERPA